MFKGWGYEHESTVCDDSCDDKLLLCIHAARWHTLQRYGVHCRKDEVTWYGEKILLFLPYALIGICALNRLKYFYSQLHHFAMKLPFLACKDLSNAWLMLIALWIQVLPGFFINILTMLVTCATTELIGSEVFELHNNPDWADGIIGNKISAVVSTAAWYSIIAWSDGV